MDEETTTTTETTEATEDSGYNSEFSGEQMDAVFRRVSRMLTGTAEFTASLDGMGYLHITDIAFAGTSPKIFANARAVSGGADGVLSVTPEYNAQTGQLLLQLFGDGVIAGERYTVDYLMLE